MHQLTGENHTQELDSEPNGAPIEDVQTFTVGGTSRYDAQRFYRVIIDTGAAKFSTAGLDQFKAL
jgi:hypothetical protein